MEPFDLAVVGGGAAGFMTAITAAENGVKRIIILEGTSKLMEKVRISGVATVTFEKTTYADLPHKFEAGTPNIAGGIAFGAALDYMNSIGFDNIANYEAELLEYGTSALKKIDGMKIYGESLDKTAVLSFNVAAIHPYDLGSILDQMGIAVRTGHHCAQPIMDFFKIPGTVRASFSFYNTFEEIDRLVQGVRKAVVMLQ